MKKKQIFDLLLNQIHPVKHELFNGHVPDNASDKWQVCGALAKVILKAVERNQFSIIWDWEKYVIQDIRIIQRDFSLFLAEAALKAGTHKNIPKDICFIFLFYGQLKQSPTMSKKTPGNNLSLQFSKYFQK